MGKTYLQMGLRDEGGRAGERRSLGESCCEAEREDGQELEPEVGSGGRVFTWQEYPVPRLPFEATQWSAKS